jgi:anti-sigma factor RsiW
MDIDTLDRLLMDRALGALPPDTDALLAAYLNHDVAAAARAQEYEAVAAAARRLVQTPAPPALPPFSTLRIREIEEARRRVRALRYVAGIAAAFVVGIGLGIGFPRGPSLRASAQPESVAPVKQTSAIPRALRLASTPEPAPPELGLWSMQRLYDNARQARHSESVRLIWDSAVSLPKPGGRL